MADTSQRAPVPRLSVLLASDAPVGVVLRRGPSKLFELVMWDSRTDKFRPGPRFRGKIYADRCDISPDGRHLIYFAMAGVAWAVPETKGTWTAISLLPSLQAVALWGQGDTWGGGGVFTSNHSFWLNAGSNAFLLRDNSGLRRETVRPVQSRLERDGWTVKKSDLGDPILERVTQEGWILRRIGCSSGYELEQPGQCTLQFPAWTWAEWDGQRLVWAVDGLLQTGSMRSGGLGSVTTLSDFNSQDTAIGTR